MVRRKHASEKATFECRPVESERVSHVISGTRVFQIEGTSHAKAQRPGITDMCNRNEVYTTGEWVRGELRGWSER